MARKNWTDVDDEILVRHYHAGADAVCTALCMAGRPSRTAAAIELRLKRMGLTSPGRAMPKGDLERLHVLHGLRVAIDETLADLARYWARYRKLLADHEQEGGCDETTGDPGDGVGALEGDRAGGVHEARGSRRPYTRSGTKDGRNGTGP